MNKTHPHENSYAEIDRVATAITGGRDVKMGGISKSGSINLPDNRDGLLKILADYSGTSDIITLAAKNIKQTANVVGGFNWKDIL